MSSFIYESGEGIILKVRVQTRASRDEVVGQHGEALKIRIAAAPVAGAANKQLIKFLAKKLKIPQSCLAIDSGASSRTKGILIRGVSAAEVLKLLPNQDVS